MLTCSGCRVARFCSADHQKMASKKAASGGSRRQGGTRISAACSASGAKLSKTVWRLTRALRTWWCFFSDECAMPDDSECVSAAVTADPSCLLSRALARSPITGDTTYIKFLYISVQHHGDSDLLEGDTHVFCVTTTVSSTVLCALSHWRVRLTQSTCERACGNEPQEERKS